MDDKTASVHFREGRWLPVFALVTFAFAAVVMSFAGMLFIAFKPIIGTIIFLPIIAGFVWTLYICSIRLIKPNELTIYVSGIEVRRFGKSSFHKWESLDGPYSIYAVKNPPLIKYNFVGQKGRILIGPSDFNLDILVLMGMLIEAQAGKVMTAAEWQAENS